MSREVGDIYINFEFASAGVICQIRAREIKSSRFFLKEEESFALLLDHLMSCTRRSAFLESAISPRNLAMLKQLIELMSYSKSYNLMSVYRGSLGGGVLEISSTTTIWISDSAMLNVRVNSIEQLTAALAVLGSEYYGDSNE